ncbi:YcxB family protein [Streptomyces sp. NBC_00503]|uniref:YcxB family protein n=1 Tax=Streptomyces sp. NBC_00503 TaxID=2903659 RepID=UPI002E8073B7|nr:YcxB family protein [Streptomyces sp. NBC_00503]WUD80547.1 YcxB family protein [Streptomyces sp. NBC_00503]
MDMDQAGRAEADTLRTARFEFAPAAADYDEALRRYSRGTRPGIVGTQLLTVALAAALAAAAAYIRIKMWGLGADAVVISVVAGVVALFWVRQKVRRSRMRRQYEADAARGTWSTTLTGDGLTTTGTAGRDEHVDWSGYPWWFETPELFVLTGSLEHFLVLPKRGAASPADLDRARALFTEHLRRI